MKNEPSIWKMHWWRRELTFLVIGTFFGIMQREKRNCCKRKRRVKNLARMKDRERTYQNPNTITFFFFFLSDAVTRNHRCSHQKPPPAAEQVWRFLAEAVARERTKDFERSCCKRMKEPENEGATEWRVSGEATSEKNFKFFHKWKEFKMLIFKLTKIPYQNPQISIFLKFFIQTSYLIGK